MRLKFKKLSKEIKMDYDKSSVRMENMNEFPLELMHDDSVWMNRLEHEEAEINCLLQLSGASTSDSGKHVDSKTTVASTRLSFDERSSNKNAKNSSKLDGKIGLDNPFSAIVDPFSGKTITSQQLDDYQVLKATVMSLTKYVSTVSKENVTLKNRLNNYEARFQKLSKSKNDSKSVENKMKSVESRLVHVERTMKTRNPTNKNISEGLAVQLDQLKKHMLQSFQSGNQHILKLINEVEEAQKVDKHKFDAAMKSLRDYLQHKDVDYKEDLCKLKKELENFVVKKTSNADELVKQVKKQQQLDEEARKSFHKRFEEMEISLGKKVATGNKKNEKVSMSISLKEEKPVISQFISKNKSDEYLDYFQKISQVRGAEKSNHDNIPETKSLSGMSNKTKSPSPENSDTAMNNLTTELKKLFLLHIPNKCILAAHLPGMYYTKIGKPFPINDIEKMKVILQKHSQSIRIIGKKDNALVLYIDPEILMHQYLRILDECEGFNATAQEVAEIFLLKSHVKVEASRIVQDVQRYKDYFVVDNRNLMRLTMKARCMLLRHSIAMLISESKYDILMSDIGNKLSKKLGWTFSLKDYEITSMRELFVSFGPNFLMVAGGGTKRQCVELGPLGKFYCEIENLLSNNEGALPLKSLSGAYLKQYRKELLFTQFGFSMVDEFVSMFSTHFKLYGEKENKSLVLINAVLDWVVSPEPVMENVVALDCEMVAVLDKKGNEIGRAGRCSVVDFNLNVIMDEYIKPEERIVDYRTKYSGLTKKQLMSSHATPFRTAREKILKLLRGKIIVGHSLHHDFESLNISWPKTGRRDLSACTLLSPKQQSLKILTKNYLHREIQTGSHSSVEDATASMELYKLVCMKWEEQLK